MKCDLTGQIRYKLARSVAECFQSYHRAYVVKKIMHIHVREKYCLSLHNAYVNRWECRSIQIVLAKELGSSTSRVHGFAVTFYTLPRSLC